MVVFICAVCSGDFLQRTSLVQAMITRTQAAPDHQSPAASVPAPEEALSDMACAASGGAVAEHGPPWPA
jgi:hypothetical protein